MQPQDDVFLEIRRRLMRRVLEESGTCSVRVRKPLIDEAKALCATSGVSVNDYVSAAVADRLCRDLADHYAASDSGSE